MPIIHDGYKVPVAGPKGVGDIAWYSVTYDEDVLTSSWMVNDTPVDAGSVLGGLEVKETSASGGVAQVKLGGGYAKRTYKITNTVDTASTTLSRSFYVDTLDL